MVEGELDMALSRLRYARHAKSPSGEAEETIGVTGHRHGHRSRSLMGSFGRVEIEVPRARLSGVGRRKAAVLVVHGPRFTISLKRSTQNQLSTSCRPITPSYGTKLLIYDVRSSVANGKHVLRTCQNRRE